jgi:pimeloyl-ACP methyl ester carboxylesterase
MNTSHVFPSPSTTSGGFPNRSARPIIAVIVCLLSFPMLAGGAPKLKGKETAWIGVQCLQYVAQGEGFPTVVFNSNTSMDSWSKVLPEVAKFTSVFADSRPGRDGSKPRMGRNTGKRIVNDLHQLLKETGQKPPYILVGHSYSGLFTNLYARTYPGEVAGVVFVDASHPDQLAWRQRHQPFQTFVGNVMAKMGHDYEYLYDFGRVSEDVKAAGPFPDVPVIVITHGKGWFLDTDAWRQQWTVFQKDLASLSPQGKQVTATLSGHVIQLDQPDIVIDAIRQMVDQIRTGASDSVRIPGSGVE